ncbi:hypothetical protein NPIL_421341 [Nephila pilipes]|uniref:Uncharacterized protein n=1 Tax=Nephila pilipes TaxID=299642 RepID=A0A8X6MP17_NEPPI|nr:hypothetical protein NPIL_421341 [Nephila pilipes]
MIIEVLVISGTLIHYRLDRLLLEDALKPVFTSRSLQISDMKVEETISWKYQSKYFGPNDNSLLPSGRTTQRKSIIVLQKQKKENR